MYLRVGAETPTWPRQRRRVQREVDDGREDVAEIPSESSTEMKSIKQLEKRSFVTRQKSVEMCKLAHASSVSNEEELNRISSVSEMKRVRSNVHATPVVVTDVQFIDFWRHS